MFIKLIRFLRGYVKFSITGKFPERFLNIAARHGILLWGAVPKDGGLQAFMYVRDYKKIRQTAGKLRIKLRVQKKYGLPFIVKKYKTRIGLPVGFAVGILIMLVLSNFIWSISISGTESLSDTYIRQVLADNGVQVGVLRNSIDVDEVAREVMLRVDKIGWMSLNITGDLISVEIKEKTVKPDIKKEEEPCNLKAKADGVITNIKVKNGTAKVVKGSGVVKGDLLVSGIVKLKTEELLYTNAKGEVMADVRSSKNFSVPVKYDYAYLSDNSIERKQVGILWNEFPCSISFENFSEFVTVNKSENVAVNDVVLPMRVNTQKENEVLKEKVSLDKNKAERLFNNEALLYEVFEKSDSKVVDRKMNIINGEKYMLCKTEYIFNENIAEKIKFSVTE